MGIGFAELVVPFSGAIQAAFSVLLTILLGVIAAQCNLLSTAAAKEVSKLCVRMFLPALLIYKIGSNLHQETGVRYIPVLSE
jgi:predicted permease